MRMYVVLASASFLLPLSPLGLFVPTVSLVVLAPSGGGVGVFSRLIVLLSFVVDYLCPLSFVHLTLLVCVVPSSQLASRHVGLWAPLADIAL